MTTIIRFVLGAVAVAAPAWMLLRAEDTTSSRPAGRVLILENERTLEGDIEHRGDQYIIRRSVGETAVPAAKVLRLCADRAEAYAYLRSRANLRDPDEHLRLAQWCQLHGLREPALAEVNAALALRPGHAASLRLQQSLQRVTATAAVSPTPRGKEDADLGLNTPAIELTGEALGVYVTKVQPILMNACASCHATGRRGTFKLTWTHDGGRANGKSTQQNLAAVLSHINLEQPQTSLFLTKAVSVHADIAQAPLKGRETRAYRTLEEWVQLTVKNNPQLRGPAATPLASVFAGDPKVAADSTPAKTEAKPVPSTTPPVRPAGPVDPFDPVIFNQQMHPEKKEGGKP